MNQSAEEAAPLTLTRVASDLSNLSQDLPMLYVSGQGSFSPDAASMSRLGDYLSGGGLLVSFGTGSPSANS